MKIYDFIKYLDDEDNLVEIRDYDTENEVFWFWTQSYFADELVQEANKTIETYEVKSFTFEKDRFIVYVDLPEVKPCNLLGTVYGEAEKD